MGQEPAFHMVGLPEMVGLFIQLGIERDDPAVRVFELLVHPHEVFLPEAQFIQGPQQLVILLPQFLLRVLSRGLDQPVRQP